MRIKTVRHVFELTGPLDLAATLDCGQSFRWAECGGEPEQSAIGNRQSYVAVVEGETVRVCKQNGMLAVECAGLPAEFWRDYFALDVDYDALHGIFRKDATLARCVDYARGIRVLRQPFFETLVSFIISQNNNIPRIKGIIKRLCENFGVPCGGTQFAFPSPEKLASLTPDDLACLRSGYRAPAIIDAAKRVASRELDAAHLRAAPFEEARKKLLKTYGVGPKIADCVLLFGLGRFEAFPIDVWMRRAMAELFPDGLPESAAPYAGIAQQYIFHYARTGANL